MCNNVTSRRFGSEWLCAAFTRRDASGVISLAPLQDLNGMLQRCDECKAAEQTSDSGTRPPRTCGDCRHSEQAFNTRHYKWYCYVTSRHVNDDSFCDEWKSQVISDSSSRQEVEKDSTPGTRDDS